MHIFASSFINIASLFTFSLLLFFGAGCGNEGEGKTEIRDRALLTDLSESKIQYRVVSLKDAHQRRRALIAQFDAMNQVIDSINSVERSKKQEFISYEFIDAVRGRHLDKDALAAEGYYKAGTLRDGEIGLFRTTTESIFPIAASAADNELYVIFEDDVSLASDLDFSFREALKLVPSDWDLLYLGCNQNSFFAGHDELASPFRPSLIAYETGRGNICPSSMTTRIYGTAWVKLDRNCTPGTWAYTLNGQSARKLKRLVDEMMPISVPIDEAYRILTRDEKINVYCLSPALVRPNFAFPSTIR